MTKYKPRSPLTQEEAIQSITRREMRLVKQRFGVSLITDFGDDAKMEDCLWAMVWLFEHRENPDFTMDQLDDFELGDAQFYFTPAPVDGEPTEAGKDSAPTPTPKLNGAS